LDSMVESTLQEAAMAGRLVTQMSWWTQAVCIVSTEYLAM